VRIRKLWKYPIGAIFDMHNRCHASQPVALGSVVPISQPARGSTKTLPRLGTAWAFFPSLG
jgi:hypothetical protein